MTLLRAITLNTEAWQAQARATGSATSGMASRSLRAICQEARRAPCGYCWADDPAWPSSFNGTAPDGLHLSRFAAARQLGLISAADTTAVIEAADVFTEATIVRDGDR
jgi:hypothetical protein